MKRVIVQINIRRTSQILLNAVLQPLTQEQRTYHLFYSLRIESLLRDNRGISLGNSVNLHLIDVKENEGISNNCPG